MREGRRLKRQENIQQILEEFRGIKSISCTKRTPIPKVENDKGETITSRKRIAKVFGELYSKVFAENQLGGEAQEP